MFIIMFIMNVSWKVIAIMIWCYDLYRYTYRYGIKIKPLWGMLVVQWLNISVYEKYGTLCNYYIITTTK